MEAKTAKTSRLSGVLQTDFAPGETPGQWEVSKGKRPDAAVWRSPEGSEW